MKNILRRKYKELRSNVQDKLLKSDIIVNKVFNLEAYKNAKTICTYMSFGDEVSTCKLIEQSIACGKVVAVPKVIDSNSIEFYIITSLKDAENVSSFGINEPIGVTPNRINKTDIDLMIIPGICFDKNKNRIGFGKGYYDRYLFDLPNKCVKIGICFDEQLMKNGLIPTNNLDIKMDMIITEDIK